MATHKISYASLVTMTLTGTSLGSNSTFVQGREGQAIDNTTNLYDDAIFGGFVTTGTTPTTNTQILVFVFAAQDPDTPTYPDQMTGADAARNITTVGVGQGYLRLAAALNVDSTTTARSYYFAGVSIAGLFGGTLPKRWGFYLAHNTGVALNSTSTNHKFFYTGVNYTIV